MGGATVEGFIKSEFFQNEDITVSDPSLQVVEKFAQQGVCATTENAVAAQGADVVMVCVKPWLVEQVLMSIKDSLDPQNQVLVVIAAGVKSESIRGWLGEQCPPLFLCIPNIAIAQLQSMTFLVPCVAASQQQIELVKGIFEQLGQVIITDE